MSRLINRFNRCVSTTGRRVPRRVCRKIQHCAGRTHPTGVSTAQASARPVFSRGTRTTGCSIGTSITISEEISQKHDLIKCPLCPKKHYGDVNMKQNNRLGYEIKMDDQYLLRPSQIEYWFTKEKLDAHDPHAPFHYHADVLTGLSLILLNPYLKTPLHKDSLDFHDCLSIWKNLEPHHQVYSRIHDRVHSIKKSLAPLSKENQHCIQNFEKNLDVALGNAQKPWGIHLDELQDLVDAIFHLESKMDHPLIYNFQFTLSKNTVQKLHYLYSLLFHLRALVGLDYNSQTKDSTFEAVKVDPILDYIPKSDYICQDAQLYWKFLQHSKKFQDDAAISEALVKPLTLDFKNHSHNAYYLIENLPPKFIQGLAPSQMGEALHLVQMDWLLGSDAGLLYRIREELYGTLGGYEKLFWPEENLTVFKPSNLMINCRLTDQDLRNFNKAG